ncbi:GNAT family N-acetyltransferase [Aestuariibius sp. 2305UL40-4]|uniref:GNAT family N-acetyltransferase n=1 Tax=Aestuariibius violaceus TaxID=3234132 RepID=UPI00345E6375
MTAATLQTRRLTLRQPQASDLPAYAAYCASERSHFVGGPFTEARTFDRFAAMIGHWAIRGFGRYVIVHEGRPIGHVGPLAVHEGEEVPELSWTLWDAESEGHGFATEAAQAVWTHLSKDLGWSEMLVRIQPENAASIRLAEKLGAERTEEPAPDHYHGCLTYRLTAKVPA